MNDKEHAASNDMKIERSVQKKMRRPTVKHHNPLNIPNMNSSNETSPAQSETDNLPLTKTAHNIIHYYVKQRDGQMPLIKEK